MTQAGHAKAVVCQPAPRMLWPRARSYRTAAGSKTCKKTPTYKTGLREVSATCGLPRVGRFISNVSEPARVQEVHMLGADAHGAH